KLTRCPEGHVVPAAQPLRDDPIDLAHANWSQRGWGEAAGGMAVVTSIMRVQQVLLARVEAILRPLGLTFARYEVLMLLLFSRSGCLPVGKIGERLQVHPASVTNAVHRLEQDGFVVRSANPADGRSVLAEITPRGRKLAERATALLNAQVFSLVPIPPDEQQDVYSTLKGLRHAFGDFL
ncbi:MAG TPA: MarR family transcriptional regulator, partial [Ilumatobacteraceae bacterium]|nr:MarR family transcriptional regulator [Ilumatobacteraceae bacterium]